MAKRHGSASSWTSKFPSFGGVAGSTRRGGAGDVKGFYDPHLPASPCSSAGGELSPRCGMTKKKRREFRTTTNEQKG